MKKQFKFIAPLALAAIMATSCGGSNHTRYVPGTKLKVGLICLESSASTYDDNFIKAFESACGKATEKGQMDKNGYEIETDIPESQECSQAAQRLIDKGCNVIFSDSYGHHAFMKQMAIENPEVIFSSATGDDAYASGVQNYHNAFASIYDGRYLAGFAAGKYLEKKCSEKVTTPFKIGYVGAHPYAEVISGYTAWYLGVKAGLADAHRDNCKMVVSYTGSWYDEDKEYTTANSLIKDDKCILISQHADSKGAPRACKDNNNTPNVSYNIFEDPEEFKDSYVASSRINWEPYFEQVIDSTYQGRTIAGEIDRNWTGGLGTAPASGSVNYDVNDSFVSEILTEMLTKASNLKSGIEFVFDTKNFTVKDHPSTEEGGPNEGKDFLTNNEGYLTHFKPDITGDFIPDKEEAVLSNGGTGTHVAESYYRSAPYFDLLIDGITIKSTTK
ncbi:MAG: BMP family ABC transporter substrate-binding protein [Bacilli bacterium]|nr:BMP family ABC transporter substrate-binding protein [Bacilli bacterium]